MYRLFEKITYNCMKYREVQFTDLFEKIELFSDENDKEGVFDTPLYDKFTEAYKVKDYEVLSNTGWIDIEGVGKTIPFNVWVLETSDGNTLKCADNHIVMRCDDLELENRKTELSEVFVKDLNQGDFVMTKSGPEMVMNVYKTNEKIPMYDLQVSRKSDHLYYTNDILSHNSLWMQNIAANAANMGYNVVYFTLEMSESKVLKRLGSMRLKIPINEYDDQSKDTEFIKSKIKDLYEGANLQGDPAGLFNQKLGKINTKFFAAGTANITHFESHLKNLEQKKGFKPDIIIVDYITLMAPIKGLGVEGNLYMKGKHLAEALRALGAKWECPIITAIQVAKDAWNASDVTLDKIPESKAIAETADTFWAIIRTEEMKRNNKYLLKLLKQRDGDFTRSKASFDLNPNYLTIENAKLVDGEV
jgi:hypothetical protein